MTWLCYKECTLMYLYLLKYDMIVLRWMYFNVLVSSKIWHGCTKMNVLSYFPELKLQLSRSKFKHEDILSKGKFKIFQG